MKRIGAVGRRKVACMLTAVLAGSAFIAAQAPGCGRPPGRGDRRRIARSRAPLLKVGQTAPDFELPTLEYAMSITKHPASQPAKGHVRLSSFRGRKPVFLIFASYT